MYIPMHIYTHTGGPAGQVPQTICIYVYICIHMYTYRYIHIQAGPACKVPQTSYTTIPLRHAYVYHGLFICVPCVPWLIHICTMTHLYVFNDSMLHITPPAPFICVPWLIYMCAMTQCRISLPLRHSCVPWHTYIYRWDLHVRCRKLVTQHLPCAMHMCTMAYSYVYHVCHGSFIWGGYD